MIMFTILVKPELYRLLFVREPARSSGRSSGLAVCVAVKTAEQRWPPSFTAPVVLSFRRKIPLTFPGTWTRRPPLTLIVWAKLTFTGRWVVRRLKLPFIVIVARRMVTCQTTPNWCRLVTRGWVTRHRPREWVTPIRPPFRRRFITLKWRSCSRRKFVNIG